MKLKITLSLLIIIILGLCCAYNPPAEVIGHWTGEQEVFAKFKRGKFPSEFDEDFY